MNALTSASNFLNYFFSTNNEIPINEAVTRIEQEALYSDDIDRKPFWGGFSREQFSSIHPDLQKTVSLFEKEGVQNKTALDLGCGNAASAMHLLEKGWQVTAVDFSQDALDTFKEMVERINPDWVKNGQLTLKCADLETFRFPENVTMIVASSVLPYINPLKVKEIWDKIHVSLAPSGRLIGNFFPGTLFEPMNKLMRAAMGGWFTDIATVRALLLDKNYEIEVCNINTIFSLTRHIQFVAKKEGKNKSKRALIPLHFSSYFDAIRSLPSKSIFSHLSPFLTDRLIELREASKIAILGSGIVTLTQTILGLDTTIASYTLVASIGAWFFLKKCAQKMEPIAQRRIRELRSIDYENSPELAAEKQKIKKLQSNEKVQKLFNPPPPKKLEEFFQELGIDLKALSETDPELSKILADVL